MYQQLKPNERWEHSETTTTIDDLKIHIAKSGHVTLTTLGDEYDEISLKAGTLFKINQLLRATRKVVKIDRPTQRNEVRIKQDGREG